MLVFMIYNVTEVPNGLPFTPRPYAEVTFEKGIAKFSGLYNNAWNWFTLNFCPDLGKQ